MKFYLPLDNVGTTLAEIYHVGDNIATVVDGSGWEAASSDNPSLATFVKGDEAANTATYMVREVLGSSGNVLALGDFVDSSSDIEFPANSLVERRITAADFSTLKSAITNAGTTIFVQNTPLSTWVVQHNLNRFPSVSVVDSGGSVVIGDVVYNSSNQITLSFAAGFSGKAFLN